MDAFSDYIHIKDNPELADLISSRCKNYLDQCSADEKYQGEKTTFFEHTLTEDTELIPLYNFLFEESFEYCKIIGIDVNVLTPSIDSIWVSNIGYRGSHPYHTHSPGSHLSGTFYVAVEEDSSPITFLSRFFYNDSWYDLPFVQKNQYSASSIRIPSFNGRLVLWKSDLIHGVLDNKTKTRIAISFNITLHRK